MSVVNVIATNTSKDKTIMHLLYIDKRSPLYLCTFYNVNLRASCIHIRGAKNVLADAISRTN